jgi:hypothetical protein
MVKGYRRFEETCCLSLKSRIFCPVVQNAGTNYQVTLRHVTFMLSVVKDLNVILDIMAILIVVTSSVM